MRLSALTRKLVRDLWHIRGQALAIAAVIGAGAGIYLTMLSTFTSLDLTLSAYYDRSRFGDVFATCKRAPLSLEPEIAAIPGVAAAELRVVVDVTLDVEGLDDPVIGHMVGIPDDRRPALCDLVIRSGRYLEPGRGDEILVSERFARAHGLEPGDGLAAVINGRRRVLRVVGIALSPEFIYPIRPGEILPDYSRYGIVWMGRRALAAAFNMEGGFNNVVLRLDRRASTREAETRLDRILEPYGGFGAIPRALQASHWYLANELMQLSSSGPFVAALFLGVAAFLVNVVLSRIVSVQREQVAALKALGYSNRAVGLHFVQWSLVIALAGGAIGLALGAWLGSATTRLYTDFFDFPTLLYRLEPSAAVLTVGISVAAAVVGALGAVRRVVALPPAEAMRPAPPERHSASLVERAGLGRWLSQPARMILRNLQRHPFRSLVSTTGIALSCALLVVGNFSMDSIDVMIETQFRVAQRYDAMVSFVEPRPARVVHELTRLPGVLAVEGFRSVPVRFRAGHRARYGAVTSLVPGSDLFRVADVQGGVVEPPAGGLLISSTLARQLGVSAGETVTVETLEGARLVHLVPVGALADDVLGAGAYLDSGLLQRMMREDRTLSGAYLQVDRLRAAALFRRLKGLPGVGAVALKEAALRSFMDTIAEMMGQMRAIDVFFAVIIAFGVVYNSARISLSERSRELATLRVIGFTRGEISYILLGEIVAVTAVAVPVGLVMGYLLSALMAMSFSTDLFRLPLVISRRTYAFAAVIVAVATAISALIVRRRLDRLDLIEVLKTRE